MIIRASCASTLHPALTVTLLTDSFCPDGRVTTFNARNLHSLGVFAWPQECSVTQCTLEQIFIMMASKAGLTANTNRNNTNRNNDVQA